MMTFDIFFYALIPSLFLPNRNFKAIFCLSSRPQRHRDIIHPATDVFPLFPVSPDPKPGPKTLKWAIAQFASVERIVGEDKYFCETCRHYAEAERSLLFDKTPEVITIHLKRFSANSLE